MERRQFLSTTTSATAVALAAASGLTPAYAQAAAGWNKAAFEAKTLAEVAKAMGRAHRRDEQFAQDHAHCVCC